MLLMELIKTSNSSAKNHLIHPPAIISIFSSFNLEYENKLKLITLPRNFEIETPFTYKARKFGRQAIKSQITAIAESRGYPFRFPVNLRTKKGIYSGKFSGQYFNQNFYRMETSGILEPKQIYYHEWWKTIAFHKSDVGLNRQYALWHNITSSPIISKKDVLFQTLFENKTFYPSKENSSSLLKGKRVENFLVSQFRDKKPFKKNKKNVSK